MSKTEITSLSARRLWDTRGWPTMEVEARLAGGAFGRAVAPSRAPKGSKNTLELRDSRSQFKGFDVTKAIRRFQLEITELLRGQDALNQFTIDRLLCELDGTPNKDRLGANTIIATSIATAQAAAAAQELPLWRHLGGNDASFLPLPEIQIFGGETRAAHCIDIQNLMVVAIGAKTFSQALDWTADVYRAAGRLLENVETIAGAVEKFGYCPLFSSNEDAIQTLMVAIEKAGFTPGQDIAISLEIAASNFYKDGRYLIDKDNRELDSDEMCAMLIDWAERYPICSIEGPLAEDDLDAMVRFTWATRNKIQVVGDNLLRKNVSKIEEAATKKVCNTVLVEPSQAGTLSETYQAFKAAQSAKMNCIASARSGEFEDTSIVHLAIGWGIPQIKVSAFSGLEGMSKLNEGLRIAHELENGALPPRSEFPWR